MNTSLKRNMFTKSHKSCYKSKIVLAKGNIFTQKQFCKNLKPRGLKLHNSLFVFPFNTLYFDTLNSLFEIVHNVPRRI